MASFRAELINEGLAWGYDYDDTILLYGGYSAPICCTPYNGNAEEFWREQAQELMLETDQVFFDVVYNSASPQGVDVYIWKLV